MKILNWGVSSYFKLSDGVSQHLMACHGVSRRLTAFQGVSRRLTASHGVSGRLTASHGVSGRLTASHGVWWRLMASHSVSRRLTATHGDSRPWYAVIYYFRLVSQIKPMLLKWDGTGLNTCHISRTWAWLNLYNIYKVFAKGNLNNRAYFQRNNKNNFKLTKFWKKFQLWQLRNRSKNVPYLIHSSSNERKFYEFFSDYRLNNTTNQENYFKVEISKNCQSSKFFTSLL